LNNRKINDRKNIFALINEASEYSIEINYVMALSRQLAYNVNICIILEDKNLINHGNADIFSLGWLTGFSILWQSCAWFHPFADFYRLKIRTHWLPNTRRCHSPKHAKQNVYGRIYFEHVHVDNLVKKCM